MPNDAKLGLVCGVALVIVVAVVFFRKDAPAWTPPEPAAIVKPVPASEAARPEPPPASPPRRPEWEPRSAAPRTDAERPVAYREAP